MSSVFLAIFTCASRFSSVYTITASVPEDMRTKQIEAGCPVVLQCVVSDPDACVYWYKEEMQLTSNSGLEILSDGNTRTLIIQSAELHHSGLYRCTTQDDVIEFQVEIKVVFCETTVELSCIPQASSTRDTLL
uniref:Ig-like domain-containing protein n=1 Tax=Oryzias melastigma TaxID=30732 RepID=A0A3B3DUM5_ORYME